MRIYNDTASSPAGVDHTVMYLHAIAGNEETNGGRISERFKIGALEKRTDALWWLLPGILPSKLERQPSFDSLNDIYQKSSGCVYCLADQNQSGRAVSRPHIRPGYGLPSESLLWYP